VRASDSSSPWLAFPAARTPTCVLLRSRAASDPLSIVIEEKVVCAMSRDGSCESMEVKGSLSLTIHSADATRCKVMLRRGDTSGYQFQNHPNVNKALFTSDGVLALKQADREFPTGTACGAFPARSSVLRRSCLWMPAGPCAAACVPCRCGCVLGATGGGWE
jgi:hypothetical protein